MSEPSRSPHSLDRPGPPSFLEALVRGDWRHGPEGRRDPVGWLAEQVGASPDFVAAQLEHEARQLDRPGDRSAADAAAARLASHRACVPDGLDGDRARAVLDATIAAMFAGYAEHLARSFVRRRATRPTEDAGAYHGAALEALMGAVREHHPDEGGLAGGIRSRVERALRAESAHQHSAARIGDITAARGVDLSGVTTRLGDRSDRSRRRAAAEAKEAIAGAVADPGSGLADAERRLLLAFLDGGAANLTAAAEQAGMHVSRASQLLPRIARRLLRAAPELADDLADAGIAPRGGARDAGR